MKRPLLLLPVFLTATGVVAGRYCWPPGEGQVKKEAGLTKAVTRHAGSAEGNAGTEPAIRPENPEAAKVWDFLQRLSTAQSREFPAFWEELEAAGKADQSPDMEFTTEETLVAQRWAELDPQAACAFFAAGAGRTGMLRAVFGVWSPRDEKAALEGLSNLPNPELRALAAAGIFSTAADDPAGLIAWARRLSFLDARSLRSKAFDDVIPPEALRAAFELDPAACRELAQKMPAWFTRRLDACGNLRDAVMDLPALYKRIDSLAGVSREDTREFMESMVPLAEAHPAKMLAIMEHLTERFGSGWLTSEDSAAMQQALPLLAKSAPDRIRGILEGAFARNPASDMTRYEAAASLMATSPRLALDLAPPGNPWLSDFLIGPMSLPPMGTPVETLNLIRTAPSSMMRDSLMEQAFAAIKKENPEAAAAWVESLPQGELKEVAGTILTAAPMDPRHAQLTRAVISVNAGGADAASLERVTYLAKLASGSDPEAASAFIISLPSGEARNAALTATGKEWAGQFIPGALAWAEGLPVASRGPALAGVLESWAGSEPAAASEYVAGMAAGAGRDLPVSSFARGLMDIEPEASLRWAATVQDPAIRRAVLNEISAKWMDSDPLVARAGIAGVPGLTAEERQRLIQPATYR